MRKFSQFIGEKKKEYDGAVITSEEVSDFINKYKKDLPLDVIKATYLADKLGLNDPSKLDEIRNSKKPQLKKLVDQLNISITDLEDLWKFFTDMKENYHMMPQYISKSERELILAGKMYLRDTMIDTSTKEGQEALFNQYIPLVRSLAKQYAANTNRSQSDLISAGSEGLAMAISKYKKEINDKTGKVASFGAYAKQYVLGYIKNDVVDNMFGTSGINDYAIKNGLVGDTVNIDHMFGKDGEIKQDYIEPLGREDKGNVDEQIEKLITILSKKFSQRDVDIFMRYFGIGGREKMKSKDIATMYKLSETAIKNGPINKIIKFIKQNPTLMEIMFEIRDIYNEALLSKCYGMNREQISEYLLNDDGYVILEEMSRWSDKGRFKRNVESALNKVKAPVLKDILKGDFTTIDDNIKIHSNEIKVFLALMYPTDNISQMSDVEMIELMSEVQEYYKKYKLA